jgi:hypothetical protein
MREGLTVLSKNEETGVVTLEAKLTKKDTTQLDVCHDYLGITSTQSVQNSDGSWAGSIPTYIQIPIRLLAKVILPYLNEHKYCQPEHFALRDNNKEPYCYYSQVLKTYNQATNSYLVTMIIEGTGEEVTMTEESYNKLQEQIKRGY